MADEIVKAKLPSIEECIKALNNEIGTNIMATASAVAGKVRKDWAKGIGASGQSMESEKPMNEKWKRQKVYAGKAGMINYTYHGDFVLSFIPRKFTKSNGNYGEATISFGGTSKGIKNISERAALDISLSKRTDRTRQNARKKIANSSDKSVQNIVKARGLASLRPKSFLPGKELSKYARSAFLQSLRSMVSFTK